MTDLYIYYRVRDEHAALLAPRVRAMQAGLAGNGAVKKRPQSSGGLQTWMEIYSSVPEGFEALLSQAVVDSALSDYIAGPRHTEVFMELSPCA